VYAEVGYTRSRKIGNVCVSKGTSEVEVGLKVVLKLM
jgi:hypothetical protein